MNLFFEHYEESSLQFLVLGSFQNFTTSPTEYFVDENHFTILDSEKTADIVNCIFERKQ